MVYPESDIEKAKTDYHPAWSISGIVFTGAAVKIVGVAADRVEVRRCVAAGKNWGKLTVYVYLETDDEKAYYRLNDGSTRYENLSPNIHKFKEELKNRING